MPLHYLVYESRATRLFTEAELARLLTRSRAYNHQHELSGLLLYASDGRFVQVLEGEQTAVHALHYERIVPDPRHQRVRVLADQPLDRRRFADWRMGYRAASPELLAALPGRVSTADAAFLLPALPQLPNALLDKLLDYVQYAPRCPQLEEVTG